MTDRRSIGGHVVCNSVTYRLLLSTVIYAYTNACTWHFSAMAPFAALDHTASHTHTHTQDNTSFYWGFFLFAGDVPLRPLWCSSYLIVADLSV